jgi:putative glutamine amidotransferase
MSPEQVHKPRVGIPYRTRNEELNNVRDKYEKYVEAVRHAGGEAVEISLKQSPEAFHKLVQSLDAIVLPGSPADVDPALYHAPPHAKAAAPDKDLEQTDGALLSHAVAEHKPLLAICYGLQFLNVEFGGSLIQHVSAEDDSAELKTTIPHPLSEQKASDFLHPIRIELGSRLAQLSGGTEALVDSSHHQAIRTLGHDLRITARAADGVVEAVEWTGAGNWIVGVQWHPEKMVGDPLAEALFSNLIAAARKSPVAS